MDARRQQKRLGPAPIASFEKSFEDHTAVSAACAAAAVSPPPPPPPKSSMKHANPVEQAHMSQRNGKEMEPQESRAATATTKTVRTTTTTTNNSRDPPQQQQQQHQQQQPDISVSAASASATDAGSSKSKHDGSRVTKRPPPLKTATASAVTTLVSSAEAQVATFKGTTTLTTPSTPRIELSRASSSSHHEEDSRDSSPENVFEQVGTGTLQETIGLGFREEGTLELRSSTEELYFMDPEHKKEEQEKIQQQQTQAKCSSPHTFKFDEHQSYLQQHQRKDSASSEVAALLATSGRTSRISSVGSHGSAFSRLSAVSGVSRSPSPHRMLLETSFCGPKPLENLADARDLATNETALPTAAELLEQVLLSRKHDPTQAVLAEGIQVQQGSPNRKPSSLANGDTKLTAKIVAQNRFSADDDAMAKTTITETLTMDEQRCSSKSPGQIIVGETPSGAQYVRINLKPDHMYADNGIAPNERIVEAPDSLAPIYAVNSQKKPASLSLGRQAMDETRLTPTASPKPTRHSILSKDGGTAAGSRSPSPATISVSRKSSFSSLFRLGGKDSPDSPRERSRSRSKSKERQTPQSQNVTPSKQKSVLAIFKPGKRGSSASGTDPKSSSKSVSPIDGHDQHHRSKASTPLITATGSRPNSRLRYYDEPVEGVIHIPLHTPPEEETRKLLQGIQQLNAEPKPIVAAPITASQLAAAAAALKPVGTRKDSVGSAGGVGMPVAPAFVPPPAPPRPQQIEKLQRTENLNAIHTLSSQDDEEHKTRTWSLEVNRHSSQDSQETLVGSEGSYANAIKLSDIRAARSNLTHVKEVHRNGITTAPASSAAAEIHRLPSVESTMSVCDPPRIVETVATVNAQDEDAVAKERRRLLFATRLGSGSQEQIFSTQFSISKTESLSSQLSEQVPETIMESSPTPEHLQRQITVIRRDETDEEEAEPLAKKEPLMRHGSVEATAATAMLRTSISTSEEEKSVAATGAVVVKMRRSKDSHENLSRHSRATSEEDTADGATTGGGSNSSIRHSRYLENFDVRKKYHENVPRKPKRQSISEASSTTKLEDQVATTAGTGADDIGTSTARHEQRKPTLPQPPPPSTAPSPSPPPLPSSTRVSRTPTPPIIHKSPPVAAAAPRSQSQSPVDRSGSSSRQTPTKPPRTSTPTRRRGSSSSAHDTAITPPLYARPAPPLPQTPSPPPSGDINTPPSKHAARKQQQQQTQADRQSVHSTDEPIESSDSDHTTAGGGGDSSAATTIDPKRRRHLPHHVGVIDDTESTGLVSQESFDDELPYIPTTLPEERAQGVALIPMKERANMELKTCPVDRPRSTTPLNPSHLEEFGVPTVAAMTQDSSSSAPTNPNAHDEFGGGATLVRGEKLRISLPRKDSTRDSKAQSSKSPRRISNASGKSWFEFAEEGLRANLERKDSNKQILPPPPPPPPPAAAQTKAPPASSSSSSRSKTRATVGAATTSSSKAISTSVPTTHITPTIGATTSHHTSTQRKLSGHWIDFENIPEKRKQPKRITTLPREGASSRQQPMAATSIAAVQQHQQHHHHHGHQQQSLASQPQRPPDVTSSSDHAAAAAGNCNSAATSDGKLHYNYVKPEDCQCECHEVERAGEEGSSGVVDGGIRAGTGGTLANANNKSITSVDLLQQGEDMLPLLDPDTQDGIEPSDSSREYSCYTDDEMDVPMRHSGSSRSKSSSSKLDEFPRRDVVPSPRNKKFPDNRK